MSIFLIFYFYIIYSNITVHIYVGNSKLIDSFYFMHTKVAPRRLYDLKLQLPHKLKTKNVTFKVHILKAFNIMVKFYTVILLKIN